jgi:5-methylcytosine-specific restriction endonuclease McrA
MGPDVAICKVCVETCAQALTDVSPWSFDSSKSVEVIQALFDQMNWGKTYSCAAVRAGFCCEYCGSQILSSVNDYLTWEIDCITPKGGFNEENDSLENCALACHACKHLKHQYSPLGDTRDERIKDAWREIHRQRSRKLTELRKLGSIVGIPSTLANAI